MIGLLAANRRSICLLMQVMDRVLWYDIISLCQSAQGVAR